MVGRREALTALLRDLKAAEYEFVAVTPATHERVLARSAAQHLGLRDIFGWNRIFDESGLESRFLEHLRSAHALEERRAKLRSKVRVASLGGDLFLHSAFPTEETDAVFFGPDTYRFARFIAQHLPRFENARRIVDMGSGSGAGAIVAARLRNFDRVTMVDMNPGALEFAQVNADVAGVSVEVVLSDEIPAGMDLVIANPPYMMDEGKRSYRDGGDLLGGSVAVDWVSQAIERLEPGGTMLLYTGVAYSRGEAPTVSALAQLCAETGAKLELEEIDADVFGEELERLPYADVERIAAIGAIITTFQR